jgi:multiple sugar transport system permease protein
MRRVTTEAKLLLIGIPVLIWTMLPIYHLLLFAISPKEQAMAACCGPITRTLRNFGSFSGKITTTSTSSGCRCGTRW